MANIYGFNSPDDIQRVADAVLQVERGIKTRPQRSTSPRGGIVAVICKPDADIAADTSGTCSIYYGETKGSESDTSENLTGYTRQDLVTGQWCLAVGLPNGYELIPLSCP